MADNVVIPLSSTDLLVKSESQHCRYYYMIEIVTPNRRLVTGGYHDRKFVITMILSSSRHTFGTVIGTVAPSRRPADISIRLSISTRNIVDIETVTPSRRPADSLVYGP